MKIAQARRILKNYAMQKMLLPGGLEPAELNQRLRIRQSALELLMKEGNLDRLSAYCMMEKVLRYFRVHQKRGRTLTQSTWQRCAICRRPIYTSALNKVNYCRQHTYARFLEYQQKYRAGGRLRTFLRKHAVIDPYGPIKPEARQFLDRCVTVDFLRDFSSAKTRRDLELYRQLIEQIKQRLIEELGYEHKHAEWLTLEYLSMREQQLWVQLRLL